MSAYTTQGDGTNPSYLEDDAALAASGESNAFNNLEAVFAASKQVEQNFKRERERARRLQEEMERSIKATIQLEEARRTATTELERERGSKQKLLEKARAVAMELKRTRLELETLKITQSEARKNTTELSIVTAELESHKKQVRDLIEQVQLHGQARAQAEAAANAALLREQASRETQQTATPFDRHVTEIEKRHFQVEMARMHAEYRTQLNQKQVELENERSRMNAASEEARRLEACICEMGSQLNALRASTEELRAEVEIAQSSEDPSGITRAKGEVAETDETNLKAERARFDRVARAFEAEVARMRAVYPLKDLLTLKELETKAITEKIESGQLDPVGIDAARTSLTDMSGQCERLRETLRESERRIGEQNGRIKDITERGTWVSEQIVTPPPFKHTVKGVAR